TTARGRYIVGLVSGGTNAATVGTALSNAENRPVGQHTHTITDPGHVHNPFDTGAGGGSVAVQTTFAAGTGLTGQIIPAATTGISVNNAGAVAGTNAPFVQLIACVKS